MQVNLCQCANTPNTIWDIQSMPSSFHTPIHLCVVMMDEFFWPKLGRITPTIRLSCIWNPENSSPSLARNKSSTMHGISRLQYINTFIHISSGHLCIRMPTVQTQDFLIKLFLQHTDSYFMWHTSVPWLTSYLEITAPLSFLRHIGCFDLEHNLNTLH